MYWETFRLAFIAIGIVIIMHLSLQIYEEKTQIVKPNNFILKRTVRFADEVNTDQDLVEYEKEFTNNVITDNVIADTVITDGSTTAPESVKTPSYPSQSYYADLKQELQEWIQTENSDWYAAQPPTAPQPTLQTSLEDIHAKQQQLQKQKLQQQTEPPNVQLKINMVRDAARSPDVPKNIDNTVELDANIVPQKTPLKEDNIMNSGILGGGLSAWDVTGDTYGTIN